MHYFADVWKLFGIQVRASRDGHGTHVATAVAGSALSASSDPPGKRGAASGKFDSMASGAQLAVVDVGVTGQTYLR